MRWHLQHLQQGTSLHTVARCLLRLPAPCQEHGQTPGDRLTGGRWPPAAPSICPSIAVLLSSSLNEITARVVQTHPRTSLVCIRVFVPDVRVVRRKEHLWAATKTWMMGPLIDHVSSHPPPPRNQGLLMICCVSWG